MIDRVVIRNFKRFQEVSFDLRGRHVVLVGPNNTGKTTVLQAIAAWGFALRRWRGLHDTNKRNGWQKAPITLEQFLPVSVRSFDLLWRDRSTRSNIEIEVHSGKHFIGMELESDERSPFQMFARPTDRTSRESLEAMQVQTLFVPAMTGTRVDEPVLTMAKVEQVLGQNRPGEVLRNLLADAAVNEHRWRLLTGCIRELFGIEMIEPDTTGPDIVAEYRHSGSPAKFDVASGGSGFQQVLMLLAFLDRQPGSVLLFDEPDAHLHVFLQERIMDVLRAAAARTRSLLVAATHSEVVVDTVDYEEVCILMDTPVRLADPRDVEALKDALRVIDHHDLAMAREAPGVLYLEGHTDLAILREWARVLGHPAAPLLGSRAYWRKVAADTGHRRPGIRAEDHFAALQLARPGYPCLQLVDGDSKVEGPAGQIYGSAPPKIKWRRYEIESYLVHPGALARFVERRVGAGAQSARHRADLEKHFTDTYPPAFLKDPHGDLPMLLGTKARTELLPPALAAAGLPGVPYSEFFEIASVMKPEEIHPDVVQVLDAICRAFAIGPGKGAP